MPRLFVILARDEPAAVILRRGPSEWYHLILWDTLRDRFLHGAWFHGRIYEEKCDLAPDGKLFVSTVCKYNAVDRRFTHAWTAISHPPWLHAVAAWPQGTTHGGGGRFIERRQLALRGTDALLPEFQPGGLKIVRAPTPVHSSSGEVPEADWSGRDQRDRLIWTKGGGLYHRHRRRDQLLADFTDLTPAPAPAPEWARRRL
jgi:hypothetical protein